MHNGSKNFEGFKGKEARIVPAEEIGEGRRWKSNVKGKGDERVLEAWPATHIETHLILYSLSGYGLSITTRVDVDR